MPDLQARIEALRWAANVAGFYAREHADEAEYHERKRNPHAASLARNDHRKYEQHAATLTAMADELADTADDEAVAQRTVDDSTEWRSAEEFERALKEAKKP